MRRLAPRDLEDCLAVLAAETVNVERLLQRLSALPASTDAQLVARRAELEKAIRA